MQGARAPINAVVFEQIERYEHAGDFREDRAAERLPHDPLLEQGEGQDLPVAPGDQFAIEHRSFRQLSRSRMEFGKSIGQQFVPARPQQRCSATAYELGAKAVPFPLGEVVFGSSGELPNGGLEQGVRRSGTGGDQRLGERERVGACGVDLVSFCGDQAGVKLGSGPPFPHETVRHEIDGQAARFGDGPCHQRLRDSDAKPAR